MKELKFRLWNTKYNNMEYPVHDFDGIIRVSDSYGGEIYWTSVGDMIGEEVAVKGEYECIVMQYIGLKDVNDEEIYEGDIVKIKVDKDTFKFFEIKFYKQAFALHNEDGHYGYLCNMSLPYKAIEIVGNIFEHPKLIKKERNESCL